MKISAHVSPINHRLGLLCLKEGVGKFKVLRWAGQCMFLLHSCCTPLVSSTEAISPAKTIDQARVKQHSVPICCHRVRVAECVLFSFTYRQYLWWFNKSREIIKFFELLQRIMTQIVSRRKTAFSRSLVLGLEADGSNFLRGVYGQHFFAYIIPGLIPPYIASTLERKGPYLGQCWCIHTRKLLQCV